jgi:hypothetical protein
MHQSGDFQQRACYVHALTPKTCSLCFLFVSCAKQRPLYGRVAVALDVHSEKTPRSENPNRLTVAAGRTRTAQASVSESASRPSSGSPHSIWVVPAAEGTQIPLRFVVPLSLKHPFSCHFRKSFESGKMVDKIWKELKVLSDGHASGRPTRRVWILAECACQLAHKLCQAPD